MSPEFITIIPLDEISSQILRHIRSTIEAMFNVKTDVRDFPPLKPLQIEPVYGKYHSAQVLKFFATLNPGENTKILLVTELDLYSPIFSCLYGEAQLGGSCAILSLHRLRQEFYNLPENMDLLLARTEKEVIHEIAHLLGFLHCVDVNCVMYSSNNIIQTDEKSNLFCRECNKLLMRIINNSNR